MKIIICGAGQVGESIAAHLSEEENDVTIIDQNQERIRKVLDHCDVSGVEGLAQRISHRGVMSMLSPAGAAPRRSLRSRDGPTF